MNKIEMQILQNQTTILGCLGELMKDNDYWLKATNNSIKRTSELFNKKEQDEECSDGLPQEPKEFVNSGRDEE